MHFSGKSTLSGKVIKELADEIAHAFASKLRQEPAIIRPDKQAINAHRNPSEEVKKGYTGANSITASQNKYFSALLTTPPKNWNLPASNSEQKLAHALVLDVEEKLQQRTLANTAAVRLPNSELKTKLVALAGQERKTLPVSVLIKELSAQEQKEVMGLLVTEAKKQCRPLDELLELPMQERLKDLKQDDPLRVITIARMKEVAARQAYRNDLPGKIADGAYNPKVIKAEIRQELQVGAVDSVPLDMRDLADVKEEVRMELTRIMSVPGIGLTREQARFIRHDANHLLDLYAKAYPNKTVEQQYILARDVVRAVVYQEMHDKSSFTGSDHGAKHVHHNTKNADGLHEHMEHGDYNPKDQFLEHLIHAYHDMGYTVGLGAVNFDCCKDHPFIGAKMIEENEDYFVGLLDADSYEVLKDSILCHAIAVFDMTPDAVETNGIHRNMVRAVTSISDACAVTYDRKTQEFWEQPKALVSLSRLKLFLTQYPAYKGILSNPAIIQDEWAGLDQNNLMDKMAHDIFKGTKTRLLELAESYDLAPDRKDLFKQAINSQFNAFTVNTTLGQYGARLTGVEAVANDDAAGGNPKYIPQFNMAPSIMYGVLKDLFGQDQAAEAFKKLVEEAGGSLKDIQDEINTMADAIGLKVKPQAKIKKTGVAFFKIDAHTDVETPLRHQDKAYVKHMRRLQKGLFEATREVYTIAKMSHISPVTREEMFAKLDKIRKGDVNTSFEEYLADLTAGVDPSEAVALEARLQPVMDNKEVFEKRLKACVAGEKAYRAIFDSVKTALVAAGKSEEDAKKAVIALAEAYRASGFIKSDTNAVGKLLKSDPFVLLDAAVVAEVDAKIISSRNDFKTNEQSYRRMRDAISMLLMTKKEYDYMMKESNAPVPDKKYYEHL